MASCDGDVDLVSSPRSDAGISRFRSRSFMNSSYLAVPGRGGASAGRPPAHAGMASLTPAASFSLMVPHPLKAKPASESVASVAIWRARISIGDNLQSRPLRMMDLGPSGGPGFANPTASLLTGTFYLYNRTNNETARSGEAPFE